MTATHGRVLVVDDDRSSRESTRRFLETQGFEVLEARDVADARRRLAEGVAVIVTDLVMPGADGMALLRAARDDAPHVQAIMLTGQGSERAAVAALKAGAFHYLAKPANPEELANLVRQALEKHRMSDEIAALRRRLAEKSGFAGLIGTSEPMVRVFERVRMVADAPTTVLIQGESGTGKELVARALHDGSRRRTKPFVAVNCAAMPESLVESELFGHTRGAFTGAVERRVGKFQAADRGTLFIDEVGELPLPVQPKLLRAIEARAVTPVGGNEEISLDVRIVAATNRDLDAMIAEGEFREDLYYRLNVVRICLPPLRERPEDVPLLVRAFVDEFARAAERPARELTPEALERLRAYAWPGNVRELRNVIEGMVVLSSREVLDVPDLPPEIRSPGSRIGDAPLVRPGVPLAALEREAIRLALRDTDGNRTAAAERLGISVRTLQRRLVEYGLDA